MQGLGIWKIWEPPDIRNTIWGVPIVRVTKLGQGLAASSWPAGLDLVRLENGRLRCGLPSEAIDSL